MQGMYCTRMKNVLQTSIKFSSYITALIHTIYQIEEFLLDKATTTTTEQIIMLNIHIFNKKIMRSKYDEKPVLHALICKKCISTCISKVRDPKCSR